MTRALFSVFLVASIGAAQQFSIATLAGGVPPSTPAAAVTASIGDPPRVALDSAGNLFFASAYSIFKVDRAGALTRIAGTGRRGVSGDGGQALNAQVATPVGITLDAAGNLYFTERESHLIRKITPGGLITRFAGTGVRGYFGDGGSASSATFDNPMGLAVDAAGNLYVADTGNSVIRRIDSDGAVSTFAGNGGVGYAGDGGAARDAFLNDPEGVAVDAAGNVYIADTFNHRVRVVSASGTLTTFAANGYPGYGGDGGPAASGTLVLPTDVAVDRNGNVYIADLGNSRIRKVSNGVISTLAGSTSGPSPYGVAGQAANSVRLSGPTGVAVDSAGAVYFAEGSIGSGSGLLAGDFRVWRVTPDGTILAAAGNGYKSYSGDFGAAARAQFNAPAGVAMDLAGNLYIADSQNHRVRKITPAGIVTTAAGTGVAGFSGDGGQAVQAELNTPTGVAVDAAGNLFIADTSNNRIREVFPNGVIGTVAGNGNAAFFGDGSRAITAAIHAPRGIALDAAGNLYIADTLDHRVRKVDGRGIIDTIAGRGLGYSGDGSPAPQAQLDTPSAVAVDGAGNVYIADQGNNRIRMVSAVTGAISTVLMTEGASLRAITIDSAGNLYYTGGARNRLMRLAKDGTIATIAGGDTCCYSGDGGPAAAAELNAPWGVATDPAGNLYVADSGNNAIRVIYAGSSSSFIRSVANGASNLVGPLAPGEIVVVFGAGVGPSQLVAAQLTAAGLFPTQLAGTSVLFNDTPGALLYTSAGQVSAVVPYNVSGSSVGVVVNNQGSVTAAFTLPLASVAPALFSADASGSGQALAVNPDNSVNSAAHPAAPGAFVTLFATGEGRTSPAGVDGKPASEPLPRPVLPVTVSIGGRMAFVQYAGGAPNLVAGLMQINVQIPLDLAPGIVPVLLKVGDVVGQTGVTLAVGGN